MLNKTIVTIVCFSTITFTGYKVFNTRNKIKKCWPSIKCTPLGQILHPFFGPKNISMRQNNRNCEASKFSSMFGSKISGINNNISGLTNATKKLSNGVNNARKKIQSMQKHIFQDLKNIARKIFDAYGRIAQLLVVIYGLVYKISVVFNNLLNLMKYSYYTLGSTWNGPIGGTARYFAGYF